MTANSENKQWQSEFDCVVNNEYFYALTSPADIHHLDYFRYCSPQASDKGVLHRRWASIILPKLKASKIQQVFDQHGRLVREWLQQAAETKRYWNMRAEEEANEIEQRLDRKHHLSLKDNAVDQLDAQFQRYTKKVRGRDAAPDDQVFSTSQPGPPAQLVSVDQAAAPFTASSSTPDNQLFSTSQPGPPAQPVSVDQAAAPSTASSSTPLNQVFSTGLPGPPVQPVSVDQAGAPSTASSSTPDNRVFSTSQPGPPVQPVSVDQAAAPSIASRELISDPNRTIPLAPPSGASTNDDRRVVRTPSATDSDPERDIDLALVTARRRELGDVVNAPLFTFHATIGSLDLGTPFTEYYNKCRVMKGFDAKLATDVIALSGVLCVAHETEVQLEQIGLLMPRVRREVQIPYKDIKKERSAVRLWWDAWHDQYEEDQLRAETTIEGDLKDAGEKETPRKTAKRAVSCSDAKGLLLESLADVHQTLFANLQTSPVPNFSEADGMASFLCPFITPLLQKPDIAQLPPKLTSQQQPQQEHEHLRQNQDGLKRPDIIGNFYKDKIELYYGEIAGIGDHNKCKVAIDRIRIAIWARKSADRIRYLYGLNVALLGLQVLGREINFYKFSWVDDILVMSSIGKMSFPTCLQEMCEIADNVRVWADVQELLEQTCLMLKKAQKLANPSPYTGFPGIWTPSCHSFKARASMAH
ncbi:hypothetical protein BGZ99_010459 [Dissophora globulifera]|uniref:Uncharacterized protein n=1 Tax=Dissophora globulifera TaxID=979702 RepID=A0A9P6R6L9_9FUNG|nr:hypothetical protein BGZ99_010459 [Dissophora globulifera]